MNRSRMTTWIYRTKWTNQERSTREQHSCLLTSSTISWPPRPTFCSQTKTCISTWTRCKCIIAYFSSKETPIEHLDKEDKIALVLVLLKQLQPYLSANNLSVAPPKPAMPTKPLMSKRIGFQQDTGPASGVGEVEALNRILNNINVQTKKNEMEGKLPRKPKV